MMQPAISDAAVPVARKRKKTLHARVRPLRCFMARDVAAVRGRVMTVPVSFSVTSDSVIQFASTSHIAVRVSRAFQEMRSSKRPRTN